ncbi:hypothetical protein [Saccharopolyspora pogona]|uniref:hypothetical protein n=1 Tax=Saccharopolyspora pogona TaxID=333966 RepID=UPI001684FAD1|nr:hypothetical protein [Saccharopolyspora pogona]
MVVIDHGRVIADGTAQQLKADLAGDHITITVAQPDAAPAAEAAARIASPDAVTLDGPSIKVRVPRADSTLPEYLRAFEEAGIKTIAAETARPTLDDVVLALTGRSLREAEES